MKFSELLAKIEQKLNKDLSEMDLGSSDGFQVSLSEYALNILLSEEIEVK